MRLRTTSASFRGDWQKKLQTMSYRKDMQNTTLYVIICVLLLVIFWFYSAMDQTTGFDSNDTQMTMDKNQMSSIENVILVLGKGLLPDGTAPESLKERVSIAVTVMSDYEFLSFDNTVYIVSGSDGSAFRNQQFHHPTEAKVMHDQLIDDHNIPSKSIIMEANARDTIENFYYTLTLLKRMGINKLHAIFIVTSEYHTKRCLQILKVLNTNRMGYFIDIEEIYDIGSVTVWESEEQREFRYEREAYTMNNSTQYWMSLCQNKLYLYTGGWFPKDNVDVIFDKHCNMIKRSTGELHQPF